MSINSATYPNEEGEAAYSLSFDEAWICDGAPLIIADLIGKHFSEINTELNKTGQRLTITGMEGDLT